MATTDVKVSGQQVKDLQGQQPATVVKNNVPTPATLAADAKFMEIMKRDLSKVDAANEMVKAGIKTLRIRQIEALTGLSQVYIRHKLQLGSWTKEYDEKNRVIVPTAEVAKYLATPRGTRGTRSYIIFMSDAEVEVFKKAFPKHEIRMRHDPEKARARREAKKANAAKGGVKEGTLRLSK